MTGTDGTAYAFCLDEVCSKYAYYRTVSLFSGEFVKHGRDVRHAEPVIAASFLRIMDRLGQSVAWVRSDEELTRWADAGGWVLAPVAFVEERLPCLLGSRECVRSAIGLFWDVCIRRVGDVCRNGATGSGAPEAVRRIVLERHDHKCILCGKGTAHDIALTLHHVIPYSRGGETTGGNLVPLCTACHNRHHQVRGNNPQPHLFFLARLDHGWDPALIRSAVSDETVGAATMISGNTTVSRCRLSDAPFLRRAEPAGAKSSRWPRQ